ncbi:MAG: hypothetical protein DMF14_05400 [Verrucomicrobia bacterium]|nr:MAG: hypothetical protein DMF14_05400 [Verrucomicrobiota bacterium]
MITSHSTVSLFPFRRVLLATFPILVALMALPSLRATSNTNTDLGLDAMAGNTQGFYNTAIGLGALNRNATGSRNTGVGADVLRFNTMGSYNSANGSGALSLNTTGSYNTGDGEAALHSNTTGSNNIALGYLAGELLTIGDFNIDIGNRGIAGEGHTIRIGDDNQTRTFISGVNGAAVTGLPVVVNNLGQLGVAASSARFKDEIKPMDKTSEAILALRPVTFHYRKEVDPAGTAQFGLVAEEVEKVSPTLVAHATDGSAYTVRYDAVNAMLLNEFIKEHRKVEEQGRKNEEQEATINKLASKIAQQQKQIESLAAIVEKVSDRVALSQAAPQVVANQQ